MVEVERGLLLFWWLGYEEAVLCICDLFIWHSVHVHVPFVSTNGATHDSFGRVRRWFAFILVLCGMRKVYNSFLLLLCAWDGWRCCAVYFLFHFCIC